MSEWHHCIVSYIDLIGIKDLLIARKSGAIDMMEGLHQVVHKQFSNSMHYHECAYSWNDSVILLAYLDKHPANYESIMKEVNQLKQDINTICNSYAICVKGMAIPAFLGFSGEVILGDGSNQPRHTYIRTSSMALANCFAIEEHLGKKHNKPWYVDSRIVRYIDTHQAYEKDKVAMLPDMTERTIHIYNGDLW